VRYPAGMASMQRWLVPIVFAGCDVPLAEPVLRQALAVCEMPTVEDAVDCDDPPTVDPAAFEATIDPMLPNDPFLRPVESLVRAGPEHIVAVGTYGDNFAEGAFVVAIDGAGARAWSAILASPSEVTAVAAVGDETGVWVAAAQFDGETFVRRYDLTGGIVADVVVPDFTVASLQAQPDGAVAMSGASAGDDAYVGVAADGSELWNGATNLAEGPRVEADDGVASFYDGPGAAVWEVDPRGEPEPGFPQDVGFEHAIIATSGNILAIGQTLGPLGDNTLLSRISPEGDMGVTMGIPRTLAEVVLEGPEDGAVIVGRSFHCAPGTYLATFDAAGVSIISVLIAAPPSPWVIDLEGRAASVALHEEGLILRAYEVVL
jgi:hypothetical protein